MKTRLAMVASKYGEAAPQATVCCNACRTCVQSNIFAALTALAIGLVARMRRAR